MRPIIYATLSILLAMLGIVGVREALGFRRASEERELRMVRDRVLLVTDWWEDAVAQQVDLWLTDLSSRDRDAIREREQSLRANRPWFDAFYLWEENEVNWPQQQQPPEDLALLRSDTCLAAASQQAGKVDATQAARLYHGCLGRSPPVALLAASESAELFLNADQPLAAERVIRDLGSLFHIPLHDAATYGVSARRLVYLRLQLARAADNLGRTDVAELIVRQLAFEVAFLDGAALEPLLDDLWVYPISRDWRQYGGPSLGDDDELYLRAKRRIAVFQEVRTRNWDLRDVPTIAEGPRLLVDQYGDPPYLLFFARLEMGALLAGIQLDQPALIDNFLDTVPAELRPFVSVRDPTGRVLDGNDEPLAAEVAFTRILPHLRVGVAAGALAPDTGLRTAFVQLLPIGIGILIGVFSLFGLIRSDREQALLLERQREFMTRVTHELKTPLAGIRLMAENLEMGSFRDTSQREQFARQIVKEAERLGKRLDEVIRAASQPEKEGREVVDPVELAQQVAERWRPLCEQQGVTLHLDAPRGQAVMLGRPSYLRDALTNLVDNALKYRKPDRPGDIWIRVHGDRRWVQFEVEDNGMGVPAKMRKAIFERFRRVEGPGRGLSGGHGLGLAFVAEAVLLHGGKVECREGVTGGARFIMRVRRRS
ncbi:MAG: HAMP domain-containing sensor histidine kinase [Pseudomonadota bacterium]|nr:HAMP domain-containing sensor histidine kinase [Pseudomonadota bacterium]